MAFCNSCGTNVGDSAFCNNCGARVGGAVSGGGGLSFPIDNRCIRCGADLQNGVCLSCGWTAPIQQVPLQQAPPQQYAAPMPAQYAPAPINVTVNASAGGAVGNAISGPPCPKCKSQSTELAEVRAKKVSGGKIAAGVMTGGLSLLATGVTSKQKVDWVCKVCGHSFTVKSK